MFRKYTFFFFGFVYAAASITNAQTSPVIPASITTIDIFEYFDPARGEQTLALSSGRANAARRAVNLGADNHELPAFRVIQNTPANRTALDGSSISYKILKVCSSSHGNGHEVASTDCTGQVSRELGLVLTTSSGAYNAALVRCEHPVLRTFRTSAFKRRCIDDGYVQTTSVGYGIVPEKTAQAYDKPGLILPFVIGAGAKTVGGRNGTNIVVQNLNDGGTGSLRWAVAHTGSRVITFNISGEIRLKTAIEILNRNISILGETAPAPGITLRGAGLRVKTSEVIIRHLKIRVGDSPEGDRADSRDAITVAAVSTQPVRNVIIDHNSLSWAVDENIGFNGDAHSEGVRDVSVTGNIIAEGLKFSCHPDTLNRDRRPHSMGILVASNVKNVAIIGNLLANNNFRNPLLADDANALFMGNIIYNPGISPDQSEAGIQVNYVDKDVPIKAAGGASVCMGGPDSVQRVQLSVVRNHFLPGNNTPPAYEHFAIYGEMTADSGLYLFENRGSDLTPENQWDHFYFRPHQINLKPVLDDFASSTSLHSFDSTWKMETAKLGILSMGAQPSARDVIDQRIVAGVLDRSGTHVNTPPEYPRLDPECDKWRK